MGLGVLTEMIIGRSIFKALIETLLHVQCENPCSGLYLSGSAAMNLRHYRVEGVVSLLKALSC